MEPKTPYMKLLESISNELKDEEMTSNKRKFNKGKESHSRISISTKEEVQFALENRPHLTLKSARLISDACLLSAEHSNENIAIAIFDEHKTILHFQKMDHCSEFAAKNLLQGAASSADLCFSKDIIWKGYKLGVICITRVNNKDTNYKIIQKGLETVPKE